MYHAEKLNHDRVVHDEKERFSAETMQSYIITSEVKAHKQNLFLELINFFNVGFGVSHMDSENSEYYH